MASQPTVKLQQCVTIPLGEEFQGAVFAELDYQKTGYTVMHNGTIYGEHVPPRLVDKLQELAAEKPADVLPRLNLIAFRFGH